MLSILRKKGFSKKVIWAVVIVIIISFGFFGTAYLLTGSGRTDYAGEIFGKKITIDQFNKIYLNTRIQAIRQYGYDLNRVAHLLDLETQTWDRLVLLHEADKIRIKIKNKEVVQAIAQDQSFQRNGRFDVLLYNAILRNLRVRARDYEESVRDNLKITELYKQATDSVTISEEEVFEEYKKRNEQVQVSYIFVSPKSFKNDITTEEAETKQYYEDNKSEFLMPPAINVQYVSFDFPEETPKEATSEDGEKNEESPEVDLEKEKDLVRDQADSIFEDLLINPNMGEIAKKNGLTVQTSDFFSMEQPNLTLGWSYDFLNKMFGMEINEISAPFETPNGLSIIQIKEKRESYIPEFAEARAKAEEAVIDKKAREISKEKASEHLVAMKTELDKSKLRDFPKAAKELELEIFQTPTFIRGQYLPQVGISKEFQEAAFALTQDNKISNIVETSTGYCILHLDDYVPVEDSSYAEAKGELAQTLSNEKRNTVFGDFVAQLRIEAEILNNLAPPENES